MKFEEIDKNNFFVIDSENLKEIKSRLVGYAIYDNKVIYNEQIKNDTELDGTGAYVFISEKKDNVEIYQDLNASFGVYYYENKNYFAISNSFLKLLEFIKEKFEISFNLDYAKAFISAGMTSNIYGETPINEISILPRNAFISINKNTKKLRVIEIDYKENTIDLNSKEGVDILDKWFYKWTKVIRGIAYETSNISCDLTGGIDSRGVTGLLLASNIDLRNININSIPSITEDYEIAHEIAKDFNLNLNKELNVNYNYISDIETLLNISFYSKLCFSKGLYPINKIPKQKIYNITGYGGENIRDYPYTSVKDDVLYKSEYAKKYSFEYADLIENLSNETFKKLKDKFQIKNSDDLINRLFKETRCSYHFGRSVVERFLTNNILLTPFMDPLLYQLKFTDENCNDPYLITVTIFVRYFNKLLNYKIQGNRTIDEHTLKYAKQINNKYPFDKRAHKLKKIYPKRTTKKQVQSEEGIHNREVKTFLENVFYSKSFQNSFKRYFSEDVYTRALYDFESEDIWSFVNVYGAIAVLKVIEDSEYSNYLNNSTVGWLQHFLEIPPYSDNNSKIQIGNSIFKLPPNFWIKSKTSITNGLEYINFEYVDVKNPIIENYVKGHINYMEQQGEQPMYNVFDVGDISVHKVCNSNSHTVRYWFIRKNRLYQIFTYTYNEFTEYNIKYLINTAQDISELNLGNLSFCLPPNFLIKDSNVITDDDIEIHFKLEDENGYANLNNYVNGYVGYIKQQNGIPITKEFNVNNIKVHKVCNSNSDTVRYWFVKRNVLYQIYCFNSNKNLDESVKYIINSIKVIK